MASRSEKRKSSSNVKKLIRTHLLFSVIAAPAKYIFPISATSAIIATIFLTISVTNFLMGSPSAFYLLTSLLIYVFSLLVMIAAILTHQNISIQTELWRVRMELRKGEKRPVNDEVSLRK